MTISRVAIVGVGVMGEGMIKSLVAAGVESSAISIIDKREERVDELIERYQVTGRSIREADAVILAVKPQDFEKCIEELKDDITSGTLVVSLLAGVKTVRIERHISESMRVIRVMPNTPIILGEGMSAITKGKSATDSDLYWVVNFLTNSGRTLVVEEELMDAVTSVSGSGPAYFYTLVEAMIHSAVRLGLSEQDSTLIVHQTLIGAAKMLNKSGKSAKTLRIDVTSPNGTTEAALKAFEDNNLNEIVFQALSAAKNRSAELSRVVS